METTTPFDLNQAIEQWRGSLRQSPAFRQENLDELESHLRDSIAILKDRSLSDEEAFLIATRRAGSGAALGTEFGKINSNSIWMNRILWMLIGTQVFVMARTLTNTISYVTGVLTIRQVVTLDKFVTYDNVDRTSWTIGLLCGLTQLLAYAVALTIGWRFLTRRGNDLEVWWHRASNYFGRWVVLGAICLIPVAMSFAIQMCHRFLIVRIYQSYLGSQFYNGLNYGQFSASVVESMILIALTLLLARRQLLAKTLA